MPLASDTSRTLQVLAAAVTPVVLVSATAILISGMNSRYISIADRMRSLAHEYRDERCAAVRRSVISEEIETFRTRIDLAAWAVRALYASVGCFISDAMIISATAWRSTFETATLPFFISGIALILIAIVLELMELQISARTIKAEVKDIPRL